MDPEAAFGKQDSRITDLKKKKKKQNKLSLALTPPSSWSSVSASPHSKTDSGLYSSLPYPLFSVHTNQPSILNAPRKLFIRAKGLNTAKFYVVSSLSSKWHLTQITTLHRNPWFEDITLA